MIRIADETITLAVGDSLLVVLVDGVHSPTGAAPRIVQRLRLPSEPRMTGRKRWTNGDTTFFINPRLRDDDWMGPLLRDVPEVRAFVDRAADTTARRAP